MIKASLLWQVGLIANVKLHFFLFVSVWSVFEACVLFLPNILWARQMMISYTHVIDFVIFHSY